ncbi:MAG: right-handed parallel beta-helix repeat-containing protein [Pseudomonadales bacterium]
MPVIEHGVSRVDLPKGVHAISGMISIMHVNDEGRPSPIARLPLQAKSTRSAKEHGEEYFIGDGGSDFAAGTSHGKRWRSQRIWLGISPPPGSDLWIAAGTTLHGQLLSQNAGTAEDPAMIGCYQPERTGPEPCWQFKRGGSLDKSTGRLGHLAPWRLLGSMHPGCYDTGTCDFSFRSDSCRNTADALLIIRHSWVVVRGGHIDHSSCDGITVKPVGGQGVGAGRLLGFQLLDSIVEYTGSRFLLMSGGVRFPVIANNIFRHGNKCTQNVQRGGMKPADNFNCAKGRHGGGVVTNRSIGVFGLIENNDVYMNWGEGIQCGSATHLLVRGNRIGNLRNPALYSNGCTAFISEHNLVWGNAGGFGGGKVSERVASGSRGRDIGWENYLACIKHIRGQSDVLSRNDIFVGLGTPLRAGYQREAGVRWKKPCPNGVSKPRTLSVAFLGIPTIDSWHASLDLFSNLGANIEKGIVGNSLFYDFPSGDSRCVPQIISDSNAWAVRPSGRRARRCNGPSDITAATSPFHEPDTTVPDLATLQRTSWPDIPDPAIFRPRGPLVDALRGSPSINAQKCVPDADIASWKVVLRHARHPFPIADDTALGNWQRCLYFDFGGAVRDIEMPTRGAWEARG